MSSRSCKFSAVLLAAADEVVVQRGDPQPGLIRVDFVTPLHRAPRLVHADPAVVIVLLFRFADTRVEAHDQHTLFRYGKDLEQVFFVEHEFGAGVEAVEELLEVAELRKVGLGKRLAGRLGDQPRRLAQLPIHVMVPRHHDHPLPRHAQMRGQPIQEPFRRVVLRRDTHFRHVARDHDRRGPHVVAFRQIVQIFRQLGVQRLVRIVPVRIPVIPAELEIRQVQDGQAGTHYATSLLPRWRSLPSHSRSSDENGAGRKMGAEI